MQSSENGSYRCSKRRMQRQAMKIMQSAYSWQSSTHLTATLLLLMNRGCRSQLIVWWLWWNCSSVSVYGQPRLIWLVCWEEQDPSVWWILGLHTTQTWVYIVAQQQSWQRRQVECDKCGGLQHLIELVVVVDQPSLTYMATWSSITGIWFCPVSGCTGVRSQVLQFAQALHGSSSTQLSQYTGWGSVPTMWYANKPCRRYPTTHRKSCAMIWQSVAYSNWKCWHWARVALCEVFQAREWRFSNSILVIWCQWHVCN